MHIYYTNISTLEAHTYICMYVYDVYDFCLLPLMNSISTQNMRDCQTKGNAMHFCLFSILQIFHPTYTQIYIYIFIYIHVHYHPVWKITIQHMFMKNYPARNRSATSNIFEWALYHQISQKRNCIRFSVVTTAMLVYLGVYIHMHIKYSDSRLNVYKSGVSGILGLKT